MGLANTKIVGVGEFKSSNEWKEEKSDHRESMEYPSSFNTCFSLPRWKVAHTPETVQLVKSTATYMGNLSLLINAESDAIRNSLRAPKLSAATNRIAQ